MKILEMLEDLRNPVLTKIFEFVSQAGGEILVTAVLVILFWCIDKKKAYLMGFAYFISGLAIQGLKVTFRVQRPWIKNPDLHPVESAVSGATGYSFPSGHTQNATALFTSVAYYVRKRWTMVVGAIGIALMMISRMYLGVHTPADVLTSFVLTFFIVTAVNYVNEIKDFDKAGRKKITIILVGICIVFTVYNSVLLTTNYIDKANALDMYKTAGGGFGFILGWYFENEYIKFETKAKLWVQILKVIIGICGALAIKELPRLIAKQNIFLDFSRYFVVMLWIVAIYPLIFNHLIVRKNICKS